MDERPVRRQGRPRRLFPISGEARKPWPAKQSGFFLRNLLAFLFAAAMLFAVLRRQGDASERLLAWILLLPIGVTGLWAGISHVFFPAIAAAHIRWQTSPFQFEVGMADFAVGATAYIAFWQDLSFKAAAVCGVSIFLLGDAIGYVREMMVAGNFAPGNAGLPFYMDVIYPTLAIILVIIAKHREKHRMPGSSRSLGLFFRGTPAARIGRNFSRWDRQPFEGGSIYIPLAGTKCSAMSEFGTFRTWLIWPTMSAIGGEADKSRPTCLKGAKTILDYGFSLHHSGHLTLWGVRVAFMIMR